MAELHSNDAFKTNASKPDAPGTILFPVPASRAVSDREWTVSMVETNIRARSTSPEGRLLAIFDVLDDLFNRADRETRRFIEVLSSIRASKSLESTDTVHFAFGSLLGTLCAEAEFDNSTDVSLSLRILVKGCMQKAIDGELDAALQASEMARDLFARHRVMTTDHSTSQGSSFDFDLDFELHGMFE